MEILAVWGLFAIAVVGVIGIGRALREERKKTRNAAQEENNRVLALAGKLSYILCLFPTPDGVFTFPDGDVWYTKKGPWCPTCEAWKALLPVLSQHDDMRIECVMRGEAWKPSWSVALRHDLLTMRRSDPEFPLAVRKLAADFEATGFRPGA